MASSHLEQYTVSDLIEWHDKKQLILSPTFQRGRVWTLPAQVYLIDTILRQLPIPKIYMRSIFDANTKRSKREIVDGQQRLRAILAFANDELTLTKRASEFAGLTYSTLEPEMQQEFLSYPIAVHQLINASDDDVLEIFARLNSYTVVLNAPELRQAQFQGNFKWAVYETTKRWNVLWDDFSVVTMRQRLRMLDTSLMAEMFGVVLEGVQNGGQPRIGKLYEKYDDHFDQCEQTIERVDATLSFIVSNFGDVLREERLQRTGGTRRRTAVANAPHFLMLYAAVAHALFGLPDGEMADAMPQRDSSALSDIDIARQNLALLNDTLDAEDPPSNLSAFVKASSSSTQRISSRKVRFPVYYQALLPQPL